MIAISWVSVDHDGRGGTVPDPLVWDQGDWVLSSVKSMLRLTLTLQRFQGLLVFWMALAFRPMWGHTGADVSVSLLCEFSSFLCALHWPAGAGDLGHHGDSF